MNEETTQTITFLTEGTKVLDYTIVVLLDEGGMGQVYRARDIKLKRPVALKFISPGVLSQENIRDQFLREAQALAQIEDPHVVTVYATHEFEGRPFFAMEYLRGPSLRKRIGEGKISLDEIVDITLQVCKGLSAAHKKGVIHRDLKPGNIILGEGHKTKIIDFGLVDIIEAEKINNFQFPGATLYYNSPEQVLGRRAEYRSDLFSLGVILYEMISGRKPFYGDNRSEVSYAICNEDPEPLDRADPYFPEKLQSIVSRLLNKEPEMRYATADEVIDDLVLLKNDAEYKKYLNRQNKITTRKNTWMKIIIVALFATVFGFSAFNSLFDSPENKSKYALIINNFTCGSDNLTNNIMMSLGEKVQSAFDPTELLVIVDPSETGNSMKSDYNAKIARNTCYLNGSITPRHSDKAKNGIIYITMNKYNHDRKVIRQKIIKDTIFSVMDDENAILEECEKKIVPKVTNEMREIIRTSWGSDLSADTRNRRIYLDSLLNNQSTIYIPPYDTAALLKQ